MELLWSLICVLSFRSFIVFFKHVDKSTKSARLSFLVRVFFLIPGSMQYSKTKEKGCNIPSCNLGVMPLAWRCFFPSISGTRVELDSLLVEYGLSIQGILINAKQFVCLFVSHSLGSLFD